MMSFRTMFDPERAEDLALTGSIRIGEECFVAEVKEKVLTVERGDAKSPDFAIAAPSAMPIAAMVYGKVPPGALTEARSEEHTYELQSLMRISYAVFCLKNKK